MKKFLLVIFIGTVLVTYLYGIVNEFMIEDVEEVNHISETTTIVYME